MGSPTSDFTFAWCRLNIPLASVPRAEKATFRMNRTRIRAMLVCQDLSRRTSTRPHASCANRGISRTSRHQLGVNLALQELMKATPAVLNVNPVQLDTTARTTGKQRTRICVAQGFTLQEVPPPALPVRLGRRQEWVLSRVCNTCE